MGQKLGAARGAPKRHLQVISWALAGDIVRGGRLLHFDVIPLESSRIELIYNIFDRKLMILSEIAIFSIENR